MVYRTKAKEEIRKFVLERQDKHFTVADISRHLEEKMIHMNITTIYRNLDKLIEEGILMKFKNTNEDFTVYQYRQEGENCESHLHLQCDTCGKTIHTTHSFMEKLSKDMMEEYGFNLECKESVLIGRCESCKK